jgi:hypothetical protein
MSSVLTTSVARSADGEVVAAATSFSVSPHQGSGMGANDDPPSDLVATVTVSGLNATSLADGTVSVSATAQR